MLAQLVVLAAQGSGCSLSADQYGPGPESFSKAAKSFVDALPHRSRVRRRMWGNSNTHDALVFVGAFVGLPWDPAPPKFVARFPDDETVGQYYDGQIEIKRGLTPHMERWVAIHELLHLCGFANAEVKPNTWDIFKDEVPNSARAPAFAGFHWDADSLTGRHARSGEPAGNEIMMAKVGHTPYLAAATLHNLDRAVGRNWCTDTMPCPGDRECEYFNPHLPGWCGADGQPAFPAGYSNMDPTDVGPTGGLGLSPEAIVGIVLGSIAGAALLGFLIRRVSLQTAGLTDTDSVAHLLGAGAL